QRTENPCVPSSILGGTTIERRKSSQIPETHTVSGIFVFVTNAEYGGFEQVNFSKSVDFFLTI
ncbi:MAG: hypothetical protein SNF68_09195, partial [Rikenellaceae bacterium]